MREQQLDSDAVRFTELWESHSPRILAYACRHVGPEEAQEIVSETFLVAWRRLIDLPGQPLPWLLVVARNTVANHRRSTYRGAVLAEELTRLEQTATAVHGADVTVADRAYALARLAALSAKEREALLLVSWDGLTPAEAAQVAGCSVTAFRVRLHRARRRLQSTDPATGSQPAVPPQRAAAHDATTVVLFSPRRPVPAPTSPGMSIPR